MSAVTQAAFAAALLDPSAPVPEGVTTARGVPDRLRFAVYRNNVAVGLTNSLAAGFPVVARLVGEEFFAGMARAYIATERPRSPLMFEYGRAFPDFVADFAPAASLPYLADVARIEAAWVRAYHAKDRPPLDLSDLSALPAETLVAARLAPHPAAALVCSAFPAGSIWQAHQIDVVEAPAARGGEAVLVARPALDVAVHVVPAPDAPFLEALLNDAPLGEAAAAAMAADPAFDFGRALGGLTGLGAFAAILTDETGEIS